MAGHHPQSGSLVDVTRKPIFFLSVPLRKPRTECGWQPVALISSLTQTPPGRLSSSSTLAVFAPLGGFFTRDKEDDWGGLACVRDKMLRVAARFGEPRCSEVKTELDALGPAGLWCEADRGLLGEHGFVQTANESFAETVTRSLDIGTDKLRVCIAQGQIGSSLLEKFGGAGIATDNEKHSIGGAHVRNSQGAGAVGVSTADRIH